ncbi:MAG: hypothetical protein DIU68_011285 [Chloroflexota bacterium]
MGEIPGRERPLTAQGTAGRFRLVPFVRATLTAIGHENHRN